MTTFVRLTVVAATLAACTTVAVRAAEPITIRTATAGELADNCTANARESGSDARRNFCYGFAQGAIDVRQRQSDAKNLFCFPKPGPSRPETMNQFAAWVKAGSDRRSLPSSEALFRFLGERYPCKS
jgi:hypothetical protein